MQDRGPWWASSPIVVFPLATAIFVLLLAAPIMVWGTDHAAEFYGALAAALVAGLAVAGNNYFQENRARAAKREETELQSAQQLLRLYIYLEDLLTILGLYREFVTKVTYNQVMAGTASPQDEAHWTVAQFRKTFRGDEWQRAETAIAWAAQIPTATAMPVVRAITMTQDRIENSFRMKFMDEQRFPSRNLLTGTLTILEDRIVALTGAKDIVKSALASRGFL